jgi:hypothetical protein
LRGKNDHRPACHPLVAEKNNPIVLARRLFTQFTAWLAYCNDIIPLYEDILFNFDLWS